MRGGGNDSADESGEEDPKKKKQKKKGRGGDEEEVEDIDEDAELALLQAVQEAELDSQSSQLQAQRQPPKQQQRRSSPITYTSPNKKRRSMSTVDNGQAPAPVHASGSATVGIGSQQTSGSGSGSTTAMAMATATVECVKMPSWSKCQVLMADVYGSGVTGGPFAPPACFTKDTQRAKWEAEVAKLKPFVSTLERVLAMEGGKLKDTEAKNAAKAFSKANSKLDKKLGFEAAAATNEEPTFSARVHAIRDAFECVKSLRDFVLVCSKSGSFVADQLVKQMEGAQKSLQILQPNRWVGFPFLWVQAGRIVLLFNFKFTFDTSLLPMPILHYWHWSILSDPSLIINYQTQCGIITKS